MSKKPEPDKETDSQRARAAAEREAMAGTLQKAHSELDADLVGFLKEHDKEFPDLEDNTGIRNLRDLVAKTQVPIVAPAESEPEPIISTKPEPPSTEILKVEHLAGPQEATPVDVAGDTQPSPLPAPFPSPPPVPTKPSVTKPSPETLAESRYEPDYRAPPKSRRQILVIDDDPEIRSVLEEALKENNYAVCVADNGKEGMKRLFQLNGSLDLILLDLMMPHFTGYDFLELFDESPWNYIPVVILSANLRDADLTREGEDHFVFIGKSREAMKKPIYLDSFLATVRRMADEGKRRKG